MYTSYLCSRRVHVLPSGYVITTGGVNHVTNYDVMAMDGSHKCFSFKVGVKAGDRRSIYMRLASCPCNPCHNGDWENCENPYLIPPPTRKTAVRKELGFLQENINIATELFNVGKAALKGKRVGDVILVQVSQSGATTSSDAPVEGRWVPMEIAGPPVGNMDTVPIGKRRRPKIPCFWPVCVIPEQQYKFPSMTECRDGDNNIVCYKDCGPGRKERDGGPCHYRHYEMIGVLAIREEPSSESLMDFRDQREVDASRQATAKRGGKRRRLSAQTIDSKKRGLPQEVHIPPGLVQHMDNLLNRLEQELGSEYTQQFA